MLSAMWRKTLRAAVWTLGILVAVPVVAYAVAILVNLHDREPSPDALELSAAYEARPAIADRDNAFVYVLGFNAPLDADPRDVGARRLAQLPSAVDAGAPPSTAELDYLGIDAAVSQFRTACDEVGPKCLVAYADAGQVFERWAASHPWLLERYRELIAYRAWREVVPTEVSAQLPSYAGALHGQRLLLLEAKTRADAGDAQAVAAILAGDLRFWRMVLESSDSLITKMIATAALRRHFEWGNLALRGLPAELQIEATPAEWHAPLTAAELSLRRTLVGEWVFFSGQMRTMQMDFVADALFQRQDTLNRYAAYFIELEATLDAPLRGYGAAADAAASLAVATANEAFPPDSLYNLMGALLLGSAGPADYSDYARRVADLEGTRRAALAAAALRAASTTASDVAPALAASPFRNPFDDQPLRWDESGRAILFVGLEHGARGEHRLYY
jgi:hypothetical protein